MAHQDIIKRLTRFVSKLPDGCWEWTANKTRLGYGRVTLGTRQQGTRHKAQAHRLFYEHYKGLISQGLEINHICRNRGCVNPDHLEAVTHLENMHHGKTVNGLPINKNCCVHGHLYTVTNTRIRPNGKRACRTCEREREKRRIRFR